VLERQLDLFADAGTRLEPCLPPSKELSPPPAELPDDVLIAALPSASLANSAVLAAEAARRRLAAAVPALCALCRRFAGFGGERIVPEQAAALQALADIGGRDAGRAVAEMISRAVVRGPALKVALAAAARLRSTLPVDVLQRMLRHADPGIRADACRCAHPWPELIALVVELLEDGDRMVAKTAACVLGEMGRIEARPLLASLLREDPSEEVIESLLPVADEECLVLLGRIGRSVPRLSAVVIDALEAIEHPRANVIASANRRLLRG
jgi:hypothetical protein